MDRPLSAFCAKASTSTSLPPPAPHSLPRTVVCDVLHTCFWKQRNVDGMNMYLICVLCLYCSGKPLPLDAQDDKISGGAHQPSATTTICHHQLATYTTCQHPMHKIVNPSPTCTAHQALPKVCSSTHQLFTFHSAFNEVSQLSVFAEPPSPLH